MKGILLGIVFMIASWVFYNNTEGIVPDVLRVIVCQIGMFVALFCLNLDLGII